MFLKQSTLYPELYVNERNNPKFADLCKIFIEFTHCVGQVETRSCILLFTSKSLSNPIRAPQIFEIHLFKSSFGKTSIVNF